MTTEADIKGWSAALTEAIRAGSDSAALEAVIRIVATLVVDVHRIADALEAQAELKHYQHANGR